MSNSRPHIVILGGGFGGLQAARSLARAHVRITLIDRRNHHLFQPLLYQVATAGLNPSDIAYPIRSILRKQRNVKVLLAEAQSIDTAHKVVRLDHGHVNYDYLIVATGATHSYFGREEWATHAPGLKTVEDALDIRRRVLWAYEAAERETDPVEQNPWLTFVVVGAGPTGVEMAGALAEIGKHTLVRDFRRIDPSRVRVVLVEAAGRVLGTYPPELSQAASRHLEQLGVTVRTDAYVTEVHEHGVRIGDEELPARTVLWAAGVQASPIARSLGVPLDRAGRVFVKPDLSIPRHPEVFVVGDLAAVRARPTSDSAGGGDGDPGDNNPWVPGVAPAATQGGQLVADNILRTLRGEERELFRYRDKGSMATIGRAAAVVQLGKMKLSGLAAWMLWWLVHILFIIGFRNRFLVLFGWAWSYFTFQRGARLITGEIHALPPPRTAAGTEQAQQRRKAIEAEPRIVSPVSLPTPHDTGDDERIHQTI